MAIKATIPSTTPMAIFAPVERPEPPLPLSLEVPFGTAAVPLGLPDATTPAKVTLSVVVAVVGPVATANTAPTCFAVDPAVAEKTTSTSAYDGLLGTVPIKDMLPG